MKPTEDAKMQRYNPTIGNQDYVGEAWATMQADALGEYVCHDEAADLIRTQAARIAELEEEREALSLAICGGEDAPGYAASLNVAVLEEVARSNRLSHIQALETVSRNLRHWREECGKLYSRIATLEAEKRESVMQQLASDGQACEAYAAQRVAEAEVARLREALGDALDAWDTHNETGDMMEGYWVSDARAALAEAEARSAALVTEARAEKAEADELPWRMLRLAAETFCARVENGEIRSKRSYAAFKDALNALPDAKGGV